MCGREIERQCNRCNRNCLAWKIQKCGLILKVKKGNMKKKIKGKGKNEENKKNKRNGETKRKMKRKRRKRKRRTNKN
jgi:hypothetical protein